jgi:acyl-coenzyme A synthetase/AMP-(fatty) acid ligase
LNIDYIFDRLKERSEECAIVSDAKEYSFGDINYKYKEAVSFIDRTGIQQGSVVAIVAEFSPLSIAMMLALIERNTILVPISFAVKNIDEYIRISQAQFVIYAENNYKIETINRTVEHPMLLDLIKRNSAGIIFFSSGTTGEPKAALHNLDHLMKKFMTQGRKISMLTFLLFDHEGGFNTIMHALSSGSMIATLQERSPEEVCNIIEKYKIELLPTSPTFLNMLIISRVYEKYDLSSLRIISYGTEPMPETTLKRLHEIFPDVKLKQTYGLSELGVMSTKSENSESLWMKIGGDGFEMKIVDGILYIRTQSAMLGYLNAPSPFDEEGWFNTKDKVEEKDGYIRILGRTTDLINVGGNKVYPNEVESVLLSFAGVKDAHVYGEANPITGMSVVADVSVDEGNNNREFIKKLRRFCGETLGPFKRPTAIRLKKESFSSSRFKKIR